MYTNSILAVSGALLSVAAAIPMEKRDIKWVTAYDEVIVTVPMTTTVWVNPGESHPTAASTAAAHKTHGHGHYHQHSKHTSSVVQTVTVPSSTAQAEETSVYVAPSTEEAPAPTTEAQAPAPSTYEAPTTEAPAPTSTYVAPTTQAPAPAPTTSKAPSTPSGSVKSGDITYYSIGLGSCGLTNTDSEPVVALAHGMMQANAPANPNNNPLCGKSITISYNGKETNAKIVDTCPGCSGADLDLSPSLFKEVAPNGDGRVHDVKWWYN